MPFNEGVLFENLPDWLLIGPPSTRFVSRHGHLELARALTDCGTPDRRNRIDDDSATVRHLRADTIPASRPPARLWAAVGSDLNMELPSFLDDLCADAEPFEDMDDALATAGAWVQIMGGLRMAEACWGTIEPSWRTLADFVVAHCELDRSLLRRLRTVGIDDEIVIEILEWLDVPLETSDLEHRERIEIARVLLWSAMLELAQGVASREAPDPGASLFCTGIVDVSFERFLPILGRKGLMTGTARFLRHLGTCMATRWALPEGCREGSQRAFCGRLERYHEELHRERERERPRGVESSVPSSDRRGDALYDRMQRWKAGEARFDGDALRYLTGAEHEAPTVFTAGATMIGIADDLARHLLRDRGQSVDAVVEAFARYPVVRDKVRARFEHFRRTADLVRTPEPAPVEDAVS